MLEQTQISAVMCRQLGGMTMSKMLRATTVRAVLAMAVLAVCWGSTRSAYALDTYFGFEDEVENSGWKADGYAGIDRNLGFAYEGWNNGWVRAMYGWNALWHVAYTGSGEVYSCMVRGHIRMSRNLTGGYFSIIEAGTNRILAESTFNGSMGDGNYLDVSTGIAQAHANQTVVIRVGFWGNGQDAWVQVDGLTLNCV